ncbi:MAG TPA: oxidoreductase [Actinobacteria bacterium]|nr:oxidoreductase [Actinomycetota bacterium]
MSIAHHLPALLVVTPLAGAALTFVTERRRDPVVAVLTGLTILGLSIGLVIRVLAAGPFRYEIGSWGAPVGIDLVADGASALFVLLSAVVGLAVTVYATDYFRGSRASVCGHGMFWTLWLFMWTSLNALFLTGDIFNVYVCLELVGISAVALVTLNGGSQALRAGARYLFSSMLAAMTYLLGVAIVYSATGSLDMGILRSTLVSDPAAATGLSLMVAALLLKTALVPAHFWLPSAHGSAPSPVSAALSALVVKGSYFAILRLMISVAPPGFLPGVDIVLGVLGATAIIWGSLQALAQTRIKQLVAYSTVAQIGYLFIVFPLARAGTDVFLLALGGALFHAITHALAKSGFFLAAGSLASRFGYERIDEMAGAARSAPVLVMTLALAGVTMMGLPPSGGFAAKWMLVSAALAAGQWWWALVLVTGGLLAAAYMFRLLGVLLRDSPAALNPPSGAIRTEWVPLSLAAGAALLVLASPLVTELVNTSVLVLGQGVTP